MLKPWFRLSAAALSIAGMIGLSACDPSVPVTPASIADTTLAYACPIAIAIQASAIVLTGGEKTALGIAVADCNTYAAQGVAGFTTPAIVAQAVVAAIFAIQTSSATALGPELNHRINVGRDKLRLHMSELRAAGFGADIGRNLR